MGDTNQYKFNNKSIYIRLALFCKTRQYYSLVFETFKYAYEHIPRVISDRIAISYRQIVVLDIWGGFDIKTLTKRKGYPDGGMCCGWCHGLPDGSGPIKFSNRLIELANVCIN